MILLVRHALAVPRGRWSSADQRRPLTKRGQRQAVGLVESLQPFRIDRIASSAAMRCKATIAPLAEARGLPIKTSKLLREYQGDSALEMMLATSGDVLFCTHGDVVGAILRGLRRAGWPIPARPSYAKGSAWLLHDGERCEYLRPPA